MRYLLAAALALAPAVADAQWGRPTPATTPPAAGTLPPIGLPLAPIGLPLGPIGLAPPVTTTHAPSAQSPRRQRGPGRSPWRGRGGGPEVDLDFGVPPFFWWGLPAVAAGVALPAAPPVAAPPVKPATATLWLEVEPRGAAEVHLDGYFVGHADERSPVVLEPGRYRVELRAPGYETHAIDMRADAGASLTLRRTLTPTRPLEPPPTVEPAPAAAPVPRKTFYLIPGCYLGDVPPQDAGLPARCDQSKTVVMRP